MYSALKKYLIGGLLEKETDSLKRANIIVIFYITFIPICINFILLISYVFDGILFQFIIGFISFSLFLTAFFYVKIKKDIFLVAHVLVAFACIIFALNTFLYPKAGLVNGLLLAVLILFAFNFFERKIAFIYSAFCLLAGNFNIILTGLDIEITLIDPIDQSMFQMFLTFTLLLCLAVIFIIHYQTAHRKSADGLTESLNALKISENRRKKSQAIGLIGNWEYDIVKNVLHWDEEAFKIYGVKTSESRPLLEVILSIIHPDDQDYVKSYLSLANKQEIYNFEYRIIRSTEEIRFVNIFAEVVYDHLQKPLRYYGIVQDVTDRKRAEIELKKLLEVTSFQNSKLQNFTYIVSHNIRSHSSNINSLVKFLTVSEDEEERKEILQMLSKASANLDSTLLNLNEVIRVNDDASKLKVALNLSAEIDKTISILKSEIVKNKVEVIQKVSDHIMLNVVPSYFESILLNLLSNAIKYKSPDRLPVIEISTHFQSDFVVLNFKDNGLGIDLEQNSSNLFGMYKTFHHNEDSRGIGLFLTKNHIESMNGKIEVESQVNVGTIFRVFFRID